MPSDYTDWEKEELYHCPWCTSGQVIKEPGDGDYDVGRQFICLFCFTYFFLPAVVELAEEEKKAVAAQWKSKMYVRDREDKDE